MKQRLRVHLFAIQGKLASGDDRGQVTAFVVCIFAALWLLAAIVVDGGLALAGKARALDVAQEAARTGAQQIDVAQLRGKGEVRLLYADAARAARTHVAAAGDRANVTVEGDAVTVRVTHVQPTQILSLIGVDAITVRATGSAHAEQATG